MHLIFGLEFDEGSFPDELARDDACLGVIHIGPAGLLNLLEARLGLGRQQNSATLRIGQTLKRLQALPGEHFFSRSLSIDPWATAKHLLNWRDMLILGGWDGKADDDAPHRIKSLALFEQSPVSELSPGLGERIALIKSSLENGNGCKPGISRIDCIETLDLLPFHWQNLLAFLNKSGCDVREGMPANNSESDTDLGILKQRLDAKESEKAVSGDGSLVMLSCANEFDGAEYLACWLSEQKDDSHILWITEGGSRILDYRLKTHGLPTLSTRHQSRWRTVLQVLPLALSVQWAPFSPQLCLEFLSLPRLPFPKSLAFHLSQALLEHPGRGGEMWKKAIEKCLVDEENRLKEKGISGKKLSRKLNKLESDIAFWFSDNIHNPETGMPVDTVVEICQRIANWAIAAGQKTDDPLLISAGALASDVSEIIEASGQKSITKPQLDRILDYVYVDGLNNIDDVAQASGWSAVTSPGQVWGYADTVIWWGFLDSESPDGQLPWTKSERQWLADRGVVLDEPRKERMRKAYSWQRAARCAGSRLILVCPQQAGPDPVHPHPFWDEIRHLLNLDENPQAGIIRETGTMYLQEKLSVFDLPLKQIPVTPCPPPTFEPLWIAPESTISLREIESYSSVDRLIRCPRAWVLQYVLGLYPGSSSAVPDGNQAVGTLTHKIIEILFKEKIHRTPEDAAARALALFDEMVPQMAATLLQPGREIQRGRYRTTLGKTVLRLMELITSSGLEHHCSEETIEKPFGSNSCRFRGIIDLVLTDKNGEKIFWDLKWSKRARYRREEMEKEDALQLAAYSWLLAENDIRFPSGGYYMLAQAQLLSGPCDFLPDSCIVGEINFKNIWQAANQKIGKTMDVLKEGHIEAGLTEEEITDFEDPDEFRLEARCKWCEYKNICGEKI